MLGLEDYLLFVFALSVAVNALSALMFFTRVLWPPAAEAAGNTLLLLGLPAAALAVVAIVSGISTLYWVALLVYVAFCAFDLYLDVIRRIEFRNPRRPEILVPFLVLYYVALLGMWASLWSLGFGYWLASGGTFLLTVGGSTYALEKGVG